MHTARTKKIIFLLSGEKFKEALKELKRQHTAGILTDAEKLFLIQAFDQFLEDHQKIGKFYSDRSVFYLAEIKKFLILYQLESSNYDRNRLRELMKSFLMDVRPLAELVAKPFAFCLDNTQVDPKYALELYREILAEMDPATAVKIQGTQILCYHSLPPTRTYARHILSEFMEVIV